MNNYHGKILRLSANRVWRTYPGGSQLDWIQGKTNPADSAYPEDWIASTVRAVNPGEHPADEGLARVTWEGGEALLVDLIEKEPAYFLSERHLQKFGPHPMMLVKYLDSAVRLPFQVHPTIPFAERFLGKSSGKTEAYHILSTRPEIAEPYIYLGFQRAPDRNELRRMIQDQDIVAMENCFDRIPVKPGDTFVVPAGRPHAIGEGVFMVEVMEPTDFVARVEFSVAGRIIPESARFMGRDIEFALDMFDLSNHTVEEMVADWSCVPLVKESQSAVQTESLVDNRRTDRFRVERATVKGMGEWSLPEYSILLLIKGQCTIQASETVPIALEQYDRVLVPQGIQKVNVASESGATFLVCLPPIT